MSALLLTGTASGQGAKLSYLWLWYPDDNNTANTEIGPYCSDMRPSPYRCSFGSSIVDCQRQVQAYLDAWYADFNVVITLDRPNADYYTIVVTSDGRWCPNDLTEGEVAGLAYSSGCQPITGFAGYALECGGNAHDCATTIAHEHGHMVGLEHTVSITDVMNRRINATAKGFDNQENATVDDTCNRDSQNSHQTMLAVLGAWPGGAKPSPFSATPDAGADAKKATQPVDAAHSGSAGPSTGSSSDGGQLVVLPGYDALTRPPLPDAPAMEVGSPKSGCSLVGRPAGSGLEAVLLVGPLAAGLIRRRRARRGQRADEPPLCVGPARSPSASRARAR